MAQVVILNKWVLYLNSHEVNAVFYLSRGKLVVMMQHQQVTAINWEVPAQYSPTCRGRFREGRGGG